MSKSKTPRIQYDKTTQLLGELKTLSKKNWKGLYVWMETRVPGLVSGECRMRQLGNGHRYLSDDNLAAIAQQAILAGYGGKRARAAVAYIPPSEEELKAAEQELRRERYVAEDPVERLTEGPMRSAHAERVRCAAALDAALSKMSPAGYSHADVLYMVQSWLIKNSPTAERGKRQSWIVAAPEEHGQSPFERAIFPESLPNSFAIPEHRTGMPHYIECQVKPMWENWNGTPPDKVSKDSPKTDEENPAT